MGKGTSTFLVGTAIALCLAFAPALYRGMFLGTPVEQNQISLVFRAIGDREVETANNFQAELISAARGPGPFEVGAVELKFPLGLQSYEFSSRPGFDSNDNESIGCDSLGGPIDFDVAIHMHIDETLPDIKDRLIRFAGAYQLRRYDGSPDLLVELVRTRFRDIIREPFISWCASQPALSIIQNKSRINSIALAHMNNEFSQYGLRFTMVSVISAMQVTPAQQELLNGLVTQSTETEANNLRNDQLRPLQEEVANIVDAGNIATQVALDSATVEVAAIRATAEADQRTALIELLGQDAFMFLETTIRPLEALIGSDAAITIVPNDARIYLGNAQEEE